MDSIEQSMKNVLHLLSQSNLRKKILYNGPVQLEAEYLAKLLLDMAISCEHTWEVVPNSTGNPMLYYDIEKNISYIQLRCEKCFKKARQYMNVVCIEEEI